MDFISKQLTVNELYERGSKAMPKRNRKPLFMKVSQVAEDLAMSRQSVYDLIDAGLIRRVKTTKGPRITTESVEKYYRSLMAQEDNPDP